MTFNRKLKLADYLRLKDSVFVLDERIRYFGYMDNRRGMIVSEMRHKQVDHPGESQLVRDLTFFKAAMSSWSLYFGRVRYAVVAHDAFKIMMIPLEGGLAIITTESSLPVNLVEEIFQVIQLQREDEEKELVSGKV